MRTLMVSLTWLAALAPIAWSQTPPAEVYGRLPVISDIAVSEDGERIALAQRLNDRSIVTVMEIDGSNAVYAAAVAQTNVLHGVSWIDGERVGFLVRQTFRPSEVLPRGFYYRGAPRRVDFWRHGYADLTTRRSELLTTNEDDPWQDQFSKLVAPIAGDPGFVRMIGRAPQTGARHVMIYRVPLTRAGEPRSMPPPGVNEDTTDYLLDERGEPILRMDANRPSNQWRMVAYVGGEQRLLLEGESATGSPVDVVGQMSDGRIAYMGADANGDLAAMWAVEPTGGPSQVVFAQANVDIAGGIIDPWTRRVVGAHWVHDDQQQVFFEPDLQRAYETVRARFPGGGARLLNWSRDRHQIAAYAENGLDGGAFYLFEPTTGDLTLVGRRYPELRDGPHGERQAISYRARDGVRVPAYLTLPQGREPQRLPLIVLVHGGPATRDSFSFDWWAAFLVSRGYAVLQPNFRGSEGYGQRWERAGWRQWGGLMQTDVEDGVAGLARSGVIDVSRVCIVGASYGGYAALAGSVLTPERYRCAIAVAGLSDLQRFTRQLGAQYGGESSTADYWRLSIGDDREELRAVSPVHLASQARAPILLIHGTDDSIVPIEQSRLMQRALSEAGRSSRLVELRGDDHYLSDPETRTEMLREVEAFLAEHNPARP